MDRTKRSGDAVTPAPGKTGELLYRACDFGPGVTSVTVTVAGEGVVELALDGAPVRAVLATDAPTAGPYDYVTLTTGLVAEGVRDLRVALHGPVRLARLGFAG
ncbi:Sugar hydrolase OS=Streptomyces fumanus OX=67302 GN=GCM10018772_52460 PE=4 SV=1 [Streptomyces fumanus]